MGKGLGHLLMIFGGTFLRLKCVVDNDDDDDDDGNDDNNNIDKKLSYQLYPLVWNSL